MTLFNSFRSGGPWCLYHPCWGPGVCQVTLLQPPGRFKPCGVRADADGDDYAAVLHLPGRGSFVAVTSLSAELTPLQVTVAPEGAGRGGRQRRWAHTASFTVHKLCCRERPQVPNTSFPDALPVIPRLRAEGGGDRALLPLGIWTQSRRIPKPLESVGNLQSAHPRPHQTHPMGSSLCPAEFCHHFQVGKRVSHGSRDSPRGGRAGYSPGHRRC